jgi:hypothetical protein
VKIVRDLKEALNKECYAILVQEKVSVSDGWGNADPEPRLVIEVYDTKEEWESAVSIYTRYPKNSWNYQPFQPVKLSPFTVKTHITMEPPCS